MKKNTGLPYNYDKEKRTITIKIDEQESFEITGIIAKKIIRLLELQEKEYNNPESFDKSSHRQRLLREKILENLDLEREIKLPPANFYKPFRKKSNCYGTVRLIKGEKFSTNPYPLNNGYKKVRDIFHLEKGVYEGHMAVDYSGASIQEEGKKVILIYETGVKNKIWSEQEEKTKGRILKSSIEKEREYTMKQYSNLINGKIRRKTDHSFIFIKDSKNTVICFEQFGYSGVWRFTTLENIKKERKECSIFVKDLPIEI